MFSYQLDLYENKIWIALKSWERPFTDGTALDDTLDAGTINVSCTKRSKPIKPFTKLRVIISEDGTEVDRIYRLVASTKRVRRSFAPSLGARFDWTINTIEVTKKLERRFVGAMTTTKYLSTRYGESFTVAPSTKKGKAFDNGYLVLKNNIYGPKAIGDSFTIPFFNWGVYDTVVHPAGLYATLAKGYDFAISLNMSLLSPDGETVASDGLYGTGGSASKAITVTLDKKGIYRLTYTGSINHESANYDFSAVYKIAVFSQLDKKTPPTITSVCERLLYAGITRRNGLQTQEFLLDPVFAEKYKDMESPEFSFTNSTLFDALSQVGGRIHAIPRLIPRYVRDNPTLDATKDIDDTHYYVTFDELGGNEQAPTMPAMIYQDHTINIDDWCGTLDSPSQNLCNTEDENAGAITEFGNDYITCRTEEANIEVNADNVLIRVTSPFEKIINLECGFIPEYDNGNTPIGDITPYLYEESEYQTLSSYSGDAYPYSKAWAIYYTKGDNKIKGLSFIQKGDTDISTAFNEYAIVNIINAATGISLKKGADVGQWMQQLAFKVTYVPIVNARVQARKPALDEGGDVKNQLVYNQGANVAETSFYGEKMRGAIARLGQDVEQRTYDIFKWTQMPKCGQLLDGKYISNIDAEYDITKIRITVTLTKNFNQLSRYVGLNSNYRLYDVSEKQSVDRYINYSEVILMGDRTSNNAQDKFLIKNVAQMLEETIYPLKYLPSILRGKVQVSQLKYTTKQDDTISNICAPVMAFPFGTSICFAFSMYDNYGAGFQVAEGYEDEDYKAVQRLVPYSDAYGEVEYLYFWMKTNGWTPTLQEQQNGKAQSYPASVISETDALLNTGSNPLIISKDSREHLGFVYQCHFRATRSSVVIGSGMAKYNLYANTLPSKMAAGVQSGIILLWFDHTINGLNRYFSRDEIVGIEQFTPDGLFLPPEPLAIDDDGFLFWQSRKNYTDKTIYAYAVCRAVPNPDGTITADSKYEILFGENFEDGLAPGESTPPIYFSPIISDDYELIPARWRIKKGAIAYALSTLNNPIATFVDSGTIAKEDMHSDYVLVRNSTLNYKGYQYSDFFQYSLPVPTDIVTLSFTYEDGTLKLYAGRGTSGKLLVEGTDYSVDGTTIKFTQKGILVGGVTAIYTCAQDTAVENVVPVYASPNDLEYR